MPHITEAPVLQISRFYTGWYSFRNPLIVPIRQMGRRIIELYDALSDGLNMECTNRLTFKRRPGYITVNPNAPQGTVLWMYAFKPSDFPGQIYQLVDTTVDVEYFRPGTDWPQSLIPKPSPMMSTFGQVAAYCYIANPLFNVKWDGPAGVQGITNWGIDAATNPIGPNPSGAQANLGSKDPNQPPWVANSVTLPAPPPAQIATSQYMMFWNFGFQFAETGVGVREISGIQVKLNGVWASGSGDISLNVRMAKAGALIGVTRHVKFPLNQPNLGLGGSSELWGTSWMPHDLNQYNFGLGVQAVNASGAPASFTVTSVEVAVFYLVPPDVAPAGGPLNPQVGYHYVYCYGNSYSGGMSSPSPPSFYQADPSGTGLIIAPGITVSFPPSPDPQVTHVHIFRTSDGGGIPYFELPNSPVPNGTTSLLDNAQDNELQLDSIAPDPHQNDPPPQGAIDPQWFGGRLWLHRGQTLFFASGPDTPNGNGEEAWNPVYAFGLPGEIIRKSPTPNGMIVATLDDLLIVRGISAATFTVNDFLKDLGMRTWTAADTDGPNIYLYTSDRQFLLINANGVTPVATSISDRIDVVDPRLAYVSVFRHTGLVNQLYMSDGSTVLYPLNVELQAWAVPEEPIGGVRAIATIEITPGVWQFWRGKPTPNSTISYRDLNVFTDEGASYHAWCIFGAVPVADFLTLSQIRDVVLARFPTDSLINVSVLANEVEPIKGKQFEMLLYPIEEPPELSETPSLSYICERYHWKTCKLPELMNLLFLRFDFGVSPNPDEIYAWTIAGTQVTGGSSLGPPGQLPQIQGR